MKNPFRKKTLRDALNDIQTHLDADYGRQLYHVLTALRGPDDPATSGDYKHYTTAVIRSNAFPNIGMDLGDYAYDSEYAAAARDKMVHDHTVDNHFTEHCMSAFNALGLSWSFENKKPV